MRIWMVRRKHCDVLVWSFLFGLVLLGASGRPPEEVPVVSYVTAGNIVVIDAGHGGPDAGACSADGVLEKDISLALSQKLAGELIRQGCIVICVRDSDTDLAGDDFTGSLRERKRVDLQARADLANRNQADLYVSVHLNSDPSPRWAGAQTFYEQGSLEGELIGKSIQEQLKNTLKNTRREALAADGYFLMSATSMPAVIVEAGFLSNPKEALLLQDEEYQNRVAGAVARGIVDGLKKKADGQVLLLPDGEKDGLRFTNESAAGIES